MFTKPMVVGAIRSGMLVFWTAVSAKILDWALVQNIEGLQDLVNQLGGLVTGILVTVLAGLVWWIISWLAKHQDKGGLIGLIGKVASYMFVINDQPTYTVGPTGLG